MGGTTVLIDEKAILGLLFYGDNYEVIRTKNIDITEKFIDELAEYLYKICRGVPTFVQSENTDRAWNKDTNQPYYFDGYIDYYRHLAVKDIEFRSLFEFSYDSIKSKEDHIGHFDQREFKKLIEQYYNLISFDWRELLSQLTKIYLTSVSASPETTLDK